MVMEENKISMEDLENLIARMSREVDIAVVEGKRDRIALVGLGFKKSIIDCSHLTIIDLVQGVQDSGAKTAVVLTDYDAQGREMFFEISRALEMAGVKLKNIYRKRIKEILDTRNMKTIESLKNLRKNLAD
jgi:5S rRNA maturation endonuclease (ribonuclease M5)